MLKGIDISTYQPTTPAGYDFYIIKASEGNGFKDNRLDQHYNAVKAMKKPVGFYHYARPDLGNTPEAEADWFLSLVGQHAGNAVYALDWEGDSLRYPVAWAKGWMDSVYQKTGVRPVLYTSSYEVMHKDYSAIANANYGLWFAHWGVSAPVIRAWKTWAIWQFQGSPLDTNYMNGDLSTWMKYCLSDHQKPKPQPKPEEKLPLTEDATGVYRLYNPNAGSHYFTASFKNAKAVVDAGWKYEGIAWHYKKSTVPVNVFYNSKAQDYVYTTNPKEFEALKQNKQWKQQDATFYSEGDIPIYRLYNPKAKTGQHIYTVPEKEVMNLIRAGWILEGIAFYASSK